MQDVENQSHVGNLTKNWFHKLLKIAMVESFFVLNGKIYEHYDSVMGIL